MLGFRKTANGQQPGNGDKPQAAQKPQAGQKSQAPQRPRRDSRGGGGGGAAFVSSLAGPFRKMATFLREVRVETGRVVWPSREETYTYTVVVVVAVIVVAAWVGALDSLLSNLIGALNLYH